MSGVEQNKEELEQTGWSRVEEGRDRREQKSQINREEAARGEAVRGVRRGGGGSAKELESPLGSGESLRKMQSQTQR